MPTTRIGIACALMLALVVGCSKSNARVERPTDAIVLQGAGSTFAAPLYRTWIAAYQIANGGVWIEYDAVGSGEGQARFVKGAVDFGASDTPLSPEQLSQVEGGVVTVPIASGGIALAYHGEGLPDGLNLPRDVYADIFLGKVTLWNDPRIAAANPSAKLPRLPIALVVRSDSSGTTNAFTSHLSAISETWRNGPGAGKSVTWPRVARMMPGNERVAGAIIHTEGGIGYVEFGTARAAGLHMAAVENKNGEFVMPSNQSIQVAVAGGELGAASETSVDPQQKSAYPIVTNTWLFVRKKPSDAKRAEAVAKFVGWCVGEGQSSCEALGYVRLSPERTAAAASVAATITNDFTK